MASETKPDMNVKFASANSEVTTPTTADIKAGYDAGDIPDNAEFNGIMQEQDVKSKYLNEQGIGEWDAATEYPAGAITKYNGDIYSANIANQGRTPQTNSDQGTYWTRTVSNRRFATEAEVIAGTSETTVINPALLLSIVNTVKNELMPVGFVMQDKNPINPALRGYIGTWKALSTGTALRATYTSDSTIGASVGSDTQNVPLASHNHGASFYGTSMGSRSITGSVSVPDHNHFQDGSVYAANQDGFFGESVNIAAASGYIRTQAFRPNGNEEGPAAWRTQTVSLDATFSGNAISLGTPTGTVYTETVGESNQTINVSGKYTKVMMWERTA